MGVSNTQTTRSLKCDEFLSETKSGIDIYLGLEVIKMRVLFGVGLAV